MSKNKQEKAFYSLPEFEEWKAATDNWHTWKIKYYKGDILCWSVCVTSIVNLFKGWYRAISAFGISLFLSELHQISTNFDNFWQNDGKETKIMWGSLIFHLTSLAHNKLTCGLFSRIISCITVLFKTVKNLCSKCAPRSLHGHKRLDDDDTAGWLRHQRLTGQTGKKHFKESSDINFSGKQQ